MALKNQKNEDGVRDKQRSKADKARRTFELNGTYSAKHLRHAQYLFEKRTAAVATNTTGGRGSGKEKKKGG